MSDNKIIYVLFLLIAVLLVIVGANCFLTQDKFYQPQKNKAIIDPDTNALTSVILDTDKEIYGAGENITALILIKNEFDTEKNWNLVATVKEKSADANSAYKLKQEKSLKLNSQEINRQDLNFATDKDNLASGEYKLELSVLENGQEICLKTVIFEIKQ